MRSEGRVIVYIPQEKISRENLCNLEVIKGAKHNERIGCCCKRGG
jgi:hypothetical protein